MKLIKIYLWTAFGFIFIAIFFGMYVWYTVQKLDTAIMEGDTDAFARLETPAEVKIDATMIEL